MTLKHLRSSTANKRPQASGMADGQLAMNTASGSPGLFFKDAAGNVVKIGPVHVGSGAPNASPASGGTTGNSIGEQWLDNSGGTYVFKIWDGAAWRSESGEFVNASGDTMTGSLTMGPSATLIFEGSVDDGFETTLTVTNPTADRTITLPNVTGTVVTTGDTGSVTSTMIASDTILNVDINSAAAIAGTKISPNFGGQNIATSGTFIHALASSGAPSITFSGDSNTGVYSPGPDNIAISNGGVTRFTITDSGFVRMGPGSTLAFPSLTSDATVILDGVAPSVGSASSNGLAIVSRGGAGFGGQATERLVFHSAGWSSYATISHTTNAGGNSIILDGATYIAMRANDRAVVAGINSAELEVNNTARLIAKTSELVINDDANDYDFRVEGDTKANLFFVDASTDRIGINTSAPDNILHIHDTGGTTVLRLSQAFASGASDSNMIFFESKNYNKTATIIHTGNSYGNVLQIGGVTDLYFDGDQQFFRDTAGTTSLFIGTDGQVAVAKFLTPNVPDLAFIGDPNTGVSSPDDDQFAIITAGVERVEWGTTEVVFNDGGVNYDFRIEGDTNANLFFVDASTDRVGIGTSSPSNALSVVGYGNATSGWSVGSEDGGTSGYFVSTGSTSNSIELAADPTNAGANSNLVFSVDGSERARIDSSGRLLVGTSSSADLSITSQAEFASANGAALSTLRFNDASGGPTINLGKSRGTSVNTYTIVNDGDSLGRILWSGADNTDMQSIAGQIICQVDGTPGSNDMPGRLVFSTTADGASSPTERLRITSAGLVGIGTSAPTQALQVAGAIVAGGAADTYATDGIYLQNKGSSIFDVSAWRAGVNASILTFSTDSGSDASPVEKMRITQTGNVGIGTINPVATVHINTTAQYSATNGTTTAGLFISQIGGTPADGAYGTAITLSKINSTRPGGAIASVQTSADDDQLGLAFLVHSFSTSNDTLTEALRISHAGTATFTASASNAPFIANIGASEVVRIDSSGRLLVGTPAKIGSTEKKLEVANGSFGISSFANNAFASAIVLEKGRGTVPGTSVLNGDELGALLFRADDGVDSFTTAASIYAYVDGAPGADDMPGRLVLSTTPDGTATPVERFRITNDGVIAHDQPAPAAVNATATLTVANLKAGIITSTSAAATDMTLPTGTDTEGGFAANSLYNNFTFEWSVINTGPSLVRVLAGTAHTIVGSGSVTTGTSGRFASRRTATNTFVTYRLS